MALKLAVLLVVAALVGQGMAWPRAGLVEQERMPESAMSLFLGHSPFSVIDGVKKCFGTSVQIMKEVGNQVSLFGKGMVSRLSLVGRTTKCFFMKDATSVHECGVASFQQYKDEVKRIEDEKVASKQRLSELMKALPNCLKEEPKPTPTPPTQPPTTQPPTQPPTTQPPTQPPTTQPPTQPPTTKPPPPPPTTQPPTPPN